MADEADKDSKTQEPTEKKISGAIEKGNVPFSKEVTNVFSLVAIALLGLFYLPEMTLDLGGVMKGILANSSTWSLGNESDAANLMVFVGTSVGYSLLPIFLALIVFALTASMAQNVPSLVFERIRPKLDRISLSKGLKKLFGGQGFRETGKALFKFSTAGLVASIVGLSQLDWVLSQLTVDSIQIPASIYSLFLQVLFGVTLTISILGAADYFWVNKDWKDNLKMTHQEIKDELKQSEGDPMIKLRTRSISRDRARRRMITQVKEATLVVANPTHFAVAMRYDPAIDKVPMVLAKGQGRIALKIREIAEANNIHVEEDRPLARALFDNVQIDMEIPVEFYLPLAKIIRALSDAGNSHAR